MDENGVNLLNKKVHKLRSDCLKKLQEAILRFAAEIISVDFMLEVL
jgi:hypothetical protein